MTDRPSDDATEGRLVAGRYRLTRSLGQGGMGVVWAARDELLDREVAVKEVTPPPGLDSHQRERLRERTLREARAAARISSNAAVTVYDVVEEDGRPWIVMELLPARTLAEVLREDGPMDERDAARLGLRLLEALAAAHRAGVLHRDVKPANVLYDATGHAVLTDFGIASLEGDSSMTTTGMIIGSPGYVAPERAHGQPPSAASDLWSLGVTLAAAVSGRSPFERETPLATMLAAVQEPLPEPLVHGPLGAVIERLLRKDPADRPDVDEVRRMLSQVLDGAADGSTADGPDTTPATRPMPAVTPPGHPRPESADAERTQALPLAPPVPAPAPARPLEEAPPRPPAAARPQPGPVAPAATGRRRGALPVMLTVLLLVVAAGVALAVLLDGDGTAGTTAGADPSTAEDTAAAPQDEAVEEEPTGGAAPAPEEPAEPETEAEAEPEPEPEPEPEAPEPDAAAPVVPEGFQVHEDPGYRVAVPEGWTVEPDGDTRTRFLDPGSRRYLLVEEGGEPAGDPVEDWQAQEQSVSQRLDGYELIGIEAADFRGFDTADWQFTWEPGGGTVRVLNRAVVDEDLNRAYALYWSVPVEEWDASREVFQGIARSFEPLG